MTTVFSFSRHPSYQYLLANVDAEFYIVGEWEEHIRPHPENIHFIDESEIDRALRESDVWMSHLVTPDLVYFLKQYMGQYTPRKIIQIMHGRSERVGNLYQYLYWPYRVTKRAMMPGLRAIQSLLPIDYVYISDFVAESWSMSGTTILPGALTNEIQPSDGRSGTPLIVANDIDRPHFKSDILQNIVSEKQVKICGENEGFNSEFLPWSELKEAYRESICYLNLLSPPENSFNLATLEAMAAGCPIVTVSHPKSIFEHEENALVCESATEIIESIDRLESNQQLQERLSQASRDLVEAKFSLERFTSKWEQVLHK